MGIYVNVQNRGTIALPPKLRRAYHLDQPGAQVEILEEDGRLVLVPKVAVDATQAWFWAPGWQAAEAEATRQLSAGEGTPFATDTAFLADLP
jgi:bifunctional DNA-binding transcriptional regulator/antitoxin component of YhaV-PrlF toxin-antitoxin module